MTDSFDRRTPRRRPLSTLRRARRGADPSARGVCYGPFPLTARLNPSFGEDLPWGGPPLGRSAAEPFLFRSMPMTDEQPRELEQRPQLETRHPTRPSEARFRNTAADPRRGTRSVKNSGSVRYVG